MFTEEERTCILDEIARQKNLQDPDICPAPSHLECKDVCDKIFPETTLQGCPCEVLSLEEVKEKFYSCLYAGCLNGGKGKIHEDALAINSARNEQ